MQRLLFNISTDTGTQGDTGALQGGEIAMLHWQPTTADTGGDLALTLLPKSGDTGDGFLLSSYNDILGANIQKFGTPFIAGDTGRAIHAGGPVVCAAGDRLRVKVTPGGAALAGRLYVWIKSD